MVVQQHRRRGGTFAALAAVLGVVATSGCSGGGGAVADDGRGGGHSDEVLRAADVLVGAGSSKARTSMEMATGGTRVTIRGEGGYDFQRRMGQLTVVLPKDPAGAEQHRPITELLTPGALYMKNRGRACPPTSGYGSTRPPWRTGTWSRAGPPIRSPQPNCCAVRGV